MSLFKSRLRATALHLLLSACVAAAAAAVVFLVWYPYPYRDISGGRHLFFILVAVDVLMGPLATAAIFDLRKSWPVLRKDLVIIAALQVAALTYGMWTVYVARPLHMVFEYDRFQIVHDVDLNESARAAIPADLDHQIWGRPTLISLRELSEQDRVKYALENVMGTIELSQQPDLWEAYGSATSRVLKAAEAVEHLRQRKPSFRVALDALARNSGRTTSQLVALPLVGRAEFWTVILDGQDAKPVGYLPMDPF